MSSACTSKEEQTEPSSRASTNTDSTSPAYLERASSQTSEAQRSESEHQSNMAGSISSQSNSSTRSGNSKSHLSAFGKMKAKITQRNSKNDGMEELAEDEEDFQRLKQKEIEKERRKSDYERLGLNQKTKFGSGGMNFHG